MISVATPIISEGYGQRLPDDVAGRVADNWMDAISISADNARDALQRHWKRGANIGANPVSQSKSFSRLKNIYTDILLASAASYGKKSRFKFQLDCMNAFDSKLLVLCDDEQYRPTAPTKITVLSTNTITKDGLKTQILQEFRPVAILSRHAVVRTIQRAGVHDVGQYKSFLRSTWPRLQQISPIIPFVMSGEDFCWRIPVTAPNLAAPIVLAITIGTTSMYRTEHFLVKTVLPSDVYARSSKLQELDNYLKRRTQAEMFSQEGITTTMRLINNLKEEN